MSRLLSHPDAMLPSMQSTYEETTALTLPFEPCDTFSATDGSPVCDHCGWLDADHDTGQLAA
jgi:hypothetical protein